MKKAKKVPAWMMSDEAFISALKGRKFTDDDDYTFADYAERYLMYILRTKAPCKTESYEDTRNGKMTMLIANENDEQIVNVRIDYNEVRDGDGYMIAEIVDSVQVGRLDK